jgi:hypothetical protein
MILPGHIAVAILGHKLLRQDLATIVVASVMPDIVDKGLAQVLRVTPSGRYIMHSLPGCLVAALLVGLILGKERGYAWALGHLAHLVGDPGFLPWWFPFKQYEFSRLKELGEFVFEVFGKDGLRRLAAELVMLAVALVIPVPGTSWLKRKTEVEQ